jgi:hypothetical protein
LAECYSQEGQCKKSVLAANDGKNGCVAKLLIIRGWKCISVLELMVDYGKYMQDKNLKLLIL